MCEYRFTIKGEPHGKARHRTTNTGHTYDPPANIQYAEVVLWSYKTQVKHKQVLTGNIAVEINSYFKMPKNTSKKKLEMAKARPYSYRPTKKPDADNISKMILDSLNKITYVDDAQVVDLKSCKFWAIDSEPRVEVIIKEL